MSKTRIAIITLLCVLTTSCIVRNPLFADDDDDADADADADVDADTDDEADTDTDDDDDTDDDADYPDVELDTDLNDSNDAETDGEADGEADTEESVEFRFIRSLGSGSCGDDDATIEISGETIPVGNTVIIRVGFRSIGLETISANDTAGNSYSTDGSHLNASSEGVRVDVVRSTIESPLEDGDSILLTLPDANMTVYSADVFDGITDNPPVYFSMGDGDDAQPQASITVSEAPILLLGATANINNTTHELEMGWLPLESHTGDCGSAPKVGQLHGGYQVVDSVGSFSYEATTGFDTRWAVVVVAYSVP